MQWLICWSRVCIAKTTVLVAWNNGQARLHSSGSLCWSVVSRLIITAKDSKTRREVLSRSKHMRVEGATKSGDFESLTHGVHHM